jgi:hypothetical protein
MPICPVMLMASNTFQVRARPTMFACVGSLCAAWVPCPKGTGQCCCNLYADPWPDPARATACGEQSKPVGPTAL